MPTLDDDPISIGTDPAEPQYGDQVHALLAKAAASKRIRTQVLGRRAQQALDAVDAVLKREQEIVKAEEHLARLRRGKDD